MFLQHIERNDPFLSSLNVLSNLRQTSVNSESSHYFSNSKKKTEETQRFCINKHFSFISTLLDVHSVFSCINIKLNIFTTNIKYKFKTFSWNTSTLIYIKYVQKNQMVLFFQRKGKSIFDISEMYFELYLWRNRTAGASRTSDGPKWRNVNYFYLLSFIWTKLNLRDSAEPKNQIWQFK